MGKSALASLSVLLLVGTISAPLLAGCSSTPSGTSSSMAKQLAELKGSDTVASDEFGTSVARIGKLCRCWHLGFGILGAGVRLRQELRPAGNRLPS